MLTVYSKKEVDHKAYKKYVRRAQMDYLFRNGDLLPDKCFTVVGNEKDSIFFTTKNFMEKANRFDCDEHEMLACIMSEYPNGLLIVCE